MSTSIPSSSGARISGDAYQHTFAWLQALRLLQDTTGVTRIGLEVPGAGSVDDVVVYYHPRPPIYHQLKFAQSQGELLTYGWFIAPSGRSQQSLLQRFHDSFERLTTDGVRPEMALQTNRWVDGNDPLLGAASGRAYKLFPRLREAGARSAAGKARTIWAKHLGVDEESLYELLGHLEINPGRGSLEELRRDCLDLHAAVGLRPDFEALDVGVSEIARMIGEGVREFDAGDLQEIIKRRRLAADQRRAVVVIEAIDYDPYPEAATVALDWVELFEGEEVGARCQLRDPEGWNTRLRADLGEAVATVRAQGLSDVFIRGFTRLPIAFTAGYHFSDRAGFAVATRQREAEWGTARDRTAVPVASEVVDLSGGDEIAIGLSIANDVKREVVAFLETEEYPVRRLVNLRLDSQATGRHAVADAAEARGLTQALVDAVRDAVVDAGASRVHLFLSTPNALALLLGHSWPRVPTVVYEHHGTGQGYFETFRLGE